MRSARPALFALATGQFAVGVTSLGPVGMVAEMRASLGVSTAAVAQLLTAFAVVYAVSAPLLQAAIGHWPRRATIAGAMTLAGLCCLALSQAQDYATVVAARVGMALAAAAIGPSAASAAASLVPPEKRAGALAIVFGGITVSSVAGLPISSFLAQTLGWREAWTAIGAAVLLCAPAVWLSVPEVNRGVRGSVTALLGVLSNRAQALSIATVAMLFTGGFVTYSLQAVWLVESAGAPLALVPLALFAYGAVGVCANLVSGRVARLAGVEGTISLGLALSACGALVMWAAPATPWLALPGFGLMGASWLLVIAPMQTRLVRLAGERAPLALAFNSSALYVGIALGSALSGVIHLAAGSSVLPLVTAVGMTLAQGVFALSRAGERAPAD